MKYVWLGFTATAISALSLLPTLYNIVIKKNTYSIHYCYLFLGLLAQICWFIYGIINKDTPLIMLACYLIFIYTVSITYKYKYEKNDEDLYSKMENNKKNDNLEHTLF